jgi:hypothetical protein
VLLERACSQIVENQMSRIPGKENWDLNAAAANMLENLPRISHSLGYSLPVKIFEEWNRVFPGHVRQFFEARNIYLHGFRFVSGEFLPQVKECIAMKDEFIRDLYQDFIA